jgi:hypothetical protein
MHLLAPAWVPALGIGAWWTLFMLNVHPFWSIGVSIALVEGLFPSRARTPWLGKVGILVAAALFAAGVWFNTSYSIRHYHFVASIAQFAVTGIICILFVAAAFLIPAPVPRTNTGVAPSPWLSGLITFLLGFAVFLAPVNLNWAAVAWIGAVDLIFLVLLWMFSRRNSWTPMHTFSIGAAGALVYGLNAFLGKPVVPCSSTVALASHALFLAFALAVVTVAALRTRSALHQNAQQLVP